MKFRNNGQFSKLINNNEIRYHKTADRNTNEISNNLSFHFALNGQEHFQVKCRHMSVFPGSFLTLNTGTPYVNSVNSPYPVQLLTIYFGDKFVDDFNNSWLTKDKRLLDNEPLSQERKMVLNETIYPLSVDMKYNIAHINKLVNEHNEDDLLLTEDLYHCLYHKEILQRAERLHFTEKGARNEIYRRLNLAKEYLYSNYNQSISLKQLSGYSFMSINHLLRMFKQAFHKAPHQFLMQIRL